MAQEENLIIISYIKKRLEDLIADVKMLERDGQIRGLRVTTGKKAVHDLYNSFSVLEDNVLKEQEFESGERDD